MTARWLGVVALMVLTGCVANSPVVRAPAPVSAPVIHPPPPVVLVPKVEPAPSLPPPVAEPSPEPPLPEKPVLPATPASTLLVSVQAAVAAGKLDQGAALSERALRISPRDAQLWYQLALIRNRQNRLDDAAGAARRALSLAARDMGLLQQINDLLQELAAKAAAKLAK
ncbi:MAG: hypothetical protein WCI66_01495 [Gammaproteobacteria bacterium]|jgi:hypothetical protein